MKVYVLERLMEYDDGTSRWQPVEISDSPQKMYCRYSYYSEDMMLYGKYRTDGATCVGWRVRHAILGTEENANAA